MGCMTERSEHRSSICISPLHHKSHAALPWAWERRGKLRYASYVQSRSITVNGIFQICVYGCHSCVCAYVCLCVCACAKCEHGLVGLYLQGLCGSFTSVCLNLLWANLGLNVCLEFHYACLQPPLCMYMVRCCLLPPQRLDCMMAANTERVRGDSARVI